MTEQASLALIAGRSRLGMIPSRTRAAQVRKVAGKSQLVVSALGMATALSAVLVGQLLVAALVFLLTLGLLEVMFQRALARFHASSSRPYRRAGTTHAVVAEPGLSGD